MVTISLTKKQLEVLQLACQSLHYDITVRNEVKDDKDTAYNVEVLGRYFAELLKEE